MLWTVFSAFLKFILILILLLPFYFVLHLPSIALLWSLLSIFLIGRLLYFIKIAHSLRHSVLPRLGLWRHSTVYSRDSSNSQVPGKEKQSATLVLICLSFHHLAHSMSKMLFYLILYLCKLKRKISSSRLEVFGWDNFLFCSDEECYKWNASKSPQN